MHLDFMSWQTIQERTAGVGPDAGARDGIPAAISAEVLPAGNMTPITASGTSAGATGGGLLLIMYLLYLSVC